MAETTKWRVEEQTDSGIVRSTVLDATSWEAALKEAWSTWGLPHDLQKAGVEVGLSATQVFIRGTSSRYRVAREAKRLPPRPASSVPPPPSTDAAPTQPFRPDRKAAPVPVVAAAPAPALAKKLEPRKDAAPVNGRGLFGKLPRASSPDLEEEARAARRGSRPDPAEARRGSRPDPTEAGPAEGSPKANRAGSAEGSPKANRAGSAEGSPKANRAGSAEGSPKANRAGSAEGSPARRASQIDPTERPSAHLKVPTPPPLPVTDLKKALSGQSIVPMPVLDVGTSSLPPPPRSEPPPPPAPIVEPAAVAPSAPAAPITSAPPPRPIPEIDPRRLQVLVSGAVQLYTRAQDPRDGAPVMYRQHGYALPMGTEDDEAEVFGRWMLQQLQLKVPKGAAPRLFHVAVYDEMFTGDPPILALCKLEWKEWKDRTTVSFPRRGEDSVAAVPPRAKTPSMHPTDAAPSPPPGNPAAAAKPAGRGAALFLPPVTPPSFAVQAPPKPTGSSSTGK